MLSNSIFQRSNFQKKVDANGMLGLLKCLKESVSIRHKRSSDHRGVAHQVFHRAYAIIMHEMVNPIRLGNNSNISSMFCAIILSDIVNLGLPKCPLMHFTSLLPFRRVTFTVRIKITPKVSHTFCAFVGCK